MSSFKALLPPHIIPHNDQDSISPIPFPHKPASLSPMIRDNMTLSSWLLLGGLLQGLTWALLGPISLLPTATILLYRLIDNLLMTFHITPNRYLNSAIPKKWSPQIPLPNGTFTNEPSREKIVVFHLGVRSNHPLGMLAPGMKGIAESYTEMIQTMRADPRQSGLLGTSQWIKDEDGAGNESMTVFYLRDLESLHRFAYREAHLKGVKYWSSIAKKSPHLSIYHETYVVPRGHWEAIYIHSKPTGLGDTWFEYCDRRDSADGVGEKVPESVVRGDGGSRGFVRPIVDARSGILRSKNGRLATAKMDEVQEYDNAYEGY